MGELIVGIALLLLSIIIFINAGDLPSMNESQLGPGSFPQVIAVLLGLLSLILIIQEAIKLYKGRDPEKSTSVKAQLKEMITEHKLVFITLALLLGYIIAIQIIGFIIATIAFMIVTALVVGPKTKKDIITISSISVVLTVGLYLFFQNVLQVRFPTGIFF